MKWTLDGYLRKRAIDLGISSSDANEAASLTLSAFAHCGRESQTKKMLQAIGLALMQSTKPTVIIAPSCPDYRDDEQGRPQFGPEGMGGGVPSLARRQIQFLRVILPVLSSARGLILLPDHESQKDDMCRLRGLSSAQVLGYIQLSAQAIKQEVQGEAIEVELFSQAIPDIVDRERQCAADLLANEQLRYFIQDLAQSRRAFFDRYDPDMSECERLRRQAGSIGQYQALGQWAQEHHHLVSSYSQESWHWYQRSRVALLDNPFV